MTDDPSTYIPTELLAVENSVSYLKGIGYSTAEAMNIAYLGLEQGKLNIQARIIAKQAEAMEFNYQLVAERVMMMLQQGRQEDADDGTDDAEHPDDTTEAPL